MAKSRRKAREAALSALYQLDLLRAKQDPEKVLKQVCEGMELSADQVEYASKLVLGIAKAKALIDKSLGTRLLDYDIDRVAAVDRAILRIGAYEVLFVPGLAPAITINEAVEIAKKYSTAESGRFVNGVLGRLVRETNKANWTPDMADEGDEEAPPEPELLEQPVSVEVQADSEEGRRVSKLGWKLKGDEESGDGPGLGFPDGTDE